ncbi:hypothetical protein SO802_019457 [Lithocarpus litseifolius]|uniref:RNA-binding protein 48 n=1 Tax=Lithocarpus litseifolius TaxID=425828 RepID=A0AAW2CRM8_9ROSI
MAPYKDEPPAVRVYTVCDESRYLIVKNVPALGCGDDLFKLFSSYGDVEECKPMDAEDCEPFTDVFWIKFRLVSNASRKIQRASWFYPWCFNRGFTGHNSIRDQPRSKFLTNELHSPTVKFNQMRYPV